MRLHRLAVEAFGPFVDPVEIDFDALADAGVFLLSGPTGAGKTSVLDAVCFGLYGDVPGDRRFGKHLRSDLAAPDRAPRVELEVTFAERRLRLLRSPSWQRPKRRGVGLTSQPASVVLSEWSGDGWQTLSTRLDETGHLIGDLVGMTMTQFCQVVLLPQGRFADFLRASSPERQALLQRLFRTSRFDDMETWLRERARRLRARSDRAEATVTGLLHRLHEAGRTPIATPIAAPIAARTDVEGSDDGEDSGGGWPLEEWAVRLAAPVDDLTRWVHDLATASDQAADRAADAVTRAESRLTRAQQEHQHALDLTARQARLQRVRDRLAALTEAGPARDRDHLRALRAQQAARLPDTLDDPRIHRLWRQERASLASGGRDADPEAALAGALAAASARLRDVEALAPLAAAHAALVERMPDLDRRAREADDAVADVHRRREALPQRLVAARDALADAEVAERERAGLEERLAHLVARLGALDEAASLTARLTPARERSSEAVAQQQSARETWLDLRERRLSGMAAELATGLVAGDECPVCGSAEHPHKAGGAPGAATAADERAARSVVDDAEAVVVAAEDRVRELETALAVASARAGDEPVAQVAADAERLRERVGAGPARAAALDARRVALRDLERTRDDLESVDVRARAEAVRAHATLDGARAALADHRQRLLETLGDDSDLDRLSEITVEAAGRVEALTALRDLHVAVSAAGFDSLDDASAARMPAAELAGLLTRLKRADDEAAALRALLDEPDLVAAATAEPIDPVPLAAAVHAASNGHRAAVAEAAGHRERHDRLTALGVDLEVALAAWRPVHDEHALVAGLARFVEGKAADNTQQMRLSAYVLGWRLEQVVAAANERLQTMTEARYTLAYSRERGAGEQRGGLSLRVVDSWSGESRDPVTLSGGETFVVALALALGLTDALMAESGGRRLGTLFVDEGFGGLDADTLDDVMDTLDALREGGRVVGVVSHVAGLAERIPAQLRLRPSPQGSTATLVVRPDA